jgi:hypothetical protein
MFQLFYQRLTQFNVAWDDHFFYDEPLWSVEVRLSEELLKTYLSDYRQCRWDVRSQPETREFKLGRVHQQEHYLDFLLKIKHLAQAWPGLIHNQSSWSFCIMWMVFYASYNDRQKWIEYISSQDLRGLWCQNLSRVYDHLFEHPNRIESADHAMLSLARLSMPLYVDHLNQGLTNPKSRPIHGWCDLIKTKINSSMDYTACILWLHGQGITLDDLLRTGLMHHYASYHIPHQDESVFHELIFLKQMLLEQESTRDWVPRMQTVSWDVRGYCLGQNLFGETQTHLEHIGIEAPKLDLTLVLNNIPFVLSYFGPETLNIILLAMKTQNFIAQEARDYISNYITKHRCLYSKGYIKKLAQTSLDALECWLPWVDDALIKTCLENKQWDILYFLPYQPQWIEQLTHEQVQSWIAEFLSMDQPFHEVDLTHHLLNLTQAFYLKQRKEAKSLLFELIRWMLDHPYLLEDEPINRAIRSMPDFEACLQDMLQLTLQELKMGIQNYIRNDWTKEGYHQQTQHWQYCNQRFSQRLCFRQAKRILPMELCDWYLLVAQEYAQVVNPQNPQWDVLFDHMGWLTKVSEYQQLVICHLLAHVDEENLRKKLLIHFNAFRSDDKERMILSAIHASNQGCLDWYLQDHVLTETLLKHAASQQQWKFVLQWAQLYDLNEFNQECLDQILIHAAIAENRYVLKKLLHLDLNFSSKGVSSAFVEAIKMDDPIRLRYLYPHHPGPLALKIGLNQALTTKRYHAMHFYQSFKTPQTYLTTEIERFLYSAVRQNDLELVACIMNCVGNVPSKGVVRRALQKASLHAHLQPVEAYLKQCMIEQPSHQRGFLRSPSLGTRVQSVGSTDSLFGLNRFFSPHSPASEERELKPSQSFF